MHYISGTLTVTSNLCHCKFGTTMKLPCRHVFAVHVKQGLPLYSLDGIAEQWKLTYLEEVFGNECTTDIGSLSYKVYCVVTVTCISCTKISVHVITCVGY